MARQAPTPAQTRAAHGHRVEPLAVPDIATQPHPAGEPAPHTTAEPPDQRLEDLLPEVKALAQKLGGYKKLSEIAEQLDHMAE